MDPVLEALEHYRTSATSAQKAEALSRLEKECLSTIDAYQYVFATTIKNPGYSSQQTFINHNMNPDYHLDFSLSEQTHVYTCRL